MKTNFLKILIGAGGIAATEVVEQVTSITPDVINNVVGIVGQIIIAIAALLSLFKRKKP